MLKMSETVTHRKFNLQANFADTINFNLLIYINKTIWSITQLDVLKFSKYFGAIHDSFCSFMFLCSNCV